MWRPYLTLPRSAASALRAPLQLLSLALLPPLLLLVLVEHCGAQQTSSPVRALAVEPIPMPEMGNRCRDFVRLQALF